MRQHVLLTLLVSVFTCLAFIHKTAFADPSCDAVYFDETGKVPDTDGSILKSTNLLIQQGETDVRVRTVNAVDTKAYKDQKVVACRSWQASNGDIKRNLVVIVLSMSRKVGFYYGHGLDNVFQGHDMTKEYMVPVLKRNDFSGGLVAGLDGARQMIVNARAPVRTVQPQPAPIAPAPPPAAPVIVKEQPTDFTGLWIVFGLLALAGVGYGIYRVISQRRQEQDSREAAQQAAIAEQNACNTAIVNFPQTYTVVRAIIGGTKSRLHPSESERLTKRLEALQSVYDRLSQHSGNLNESYDPSKDGCSEIQYQQAERVFGKLNAELHALEQDLQSLQSDAESVESRIRQSEDAASNLGDQIEAAEQSINDMKSKGFKTESYALSLDEAKRVLETVTIALAEKRYSDANDTCKKADTPLKNAASVTSIEQRIKNINDSIVAYEERIRTMKRAGSDAWEKLFELQQSFATSCVESVAGHEKRIAEHISGAEQLKTEIVSAGSMMQQEWDKAEKLLFAGGRLLDQAESFIQSIIQLDVNLRKAKTEINAWVAEAQCSIQDADAYNRKHDADIDDKVWNDLKKANEILSQAKQELSGTKPDYFKAVELAKWADSVADKALELCKKDHEAADKLRAKTERSMNDAKRRISEAKEYLQDHRYDLQSEKAKDLLRDAEESLNQAERTEDIRTKFQFAESAATTAKKSLDRAKEDYRSSRSNYSTSSRSVHHHHYDTDRSSNDLTSMALGYAIGSSIHSHQSGYGSGSSSSFGSDNSPRDTGFGTSSIFDSDPTPSFGGGSESSFSFDTSPSIDTGSGTSGDF